jgi:CheY-like chemotaxis protein
MKQYKLIIVENDPDEQFFMKESFDKVNFFHIIAQVKNGDDLFDWFDMNDELPDVILSDLNMPGKNGYDIIEGVKNTPAWSRIPVIITSTSSTKSIIDKCLAAGAADYIIKPDTFIDYKSYVKRLYELIEEKQLVK